MIASADLIAQHRSFVALYDGGMVGFGTGTVFVWLLMSLLALLTPIIALSVVWAIWRMTWAHERIEKHVAGIEQLLARQTGRTTP